MDAIRSSSPRTILYVAWAPFFSGAERALQILVEHLDQTKYRPVVAIGTEGVLADQLRKSGIRVVHIPIAYTGVRTLAPFVAGVGRIAALALRENAVIIHANDVPSFQPAGYAAKLLRRPALTHVRFPDKAEGFGWFLRSGFDRALFVSGALMADAQQEAPDVFQGKAQVVYDGVHVPDLATEADRRALRDELGLPANRPIVVMAGQVAEVKGIWDYIGACKILASRATSAHFVVLGDDLKNKGETRRAAEERVRAEGLSDKVTFLGFRPNAQRLIPAFDIVAVPSHVEPLGNATLEAMASARPVVGAAVGGIPEMIVNGVTGLLVPPRTPLALADALERLVVDPSRASAMGAAGRARALEVFSISAHVSAIQTQYDALLSSRLSVERPTRR